jgi:hypothetical protein
MFNLTEMVEELLFASGKPRKAIFNDVEGELREVASPLERTRRQQLKTPEGIPTVTEPSREALPNRMNLFFTPVRGARFGSLAHRRRRGARTSLSALSVVFLLTWALSTMGSELTSRILFFDARKAEEGSPGAPDHAAPEDEGAAQNPPQGNEAVGFGSSGSGEARRVEVPDVSDRGVVKAARILSRAGFEVAATKSVASQREIGTVMRTKPSAGSVVERETPVVIVTSGGPTAIPPGVWSGDAGVGAGAQYAN